MNQNLPSKSTRITQSKLSKTKPKATKATEAPEAKSQLHRSHRRRLKIGQEHPENLLPIAPPSSCLFRVELRFQKSSETCGHGRRLLRSPAISSADVAPSRARRGVLRERGNKRQQVPLARAGSAAEESPQSLANVGVASSLALNKKGLDNMSQLFLCEK